MEDVRYHLVMTMTLSNTQAKDTNKDKYKDKVLQRLNVCYIFRKSLGSRILNILLAIIDNDTLKDKNKVFQRPKVRYIFQKHGFQGYQYNISLSKVLHKKLFSKHCSPKVSWTQALNIFPGWFFFRGDYFSLDWCLIWGPDIFASCLFVKPFLFQPAVRVKVKEICQLIRFHLLFRF